MFEDFGKRRDIVGLFSTFNPLTALYPSENHSCLHRLQRLVQSKFRKTNSYVFDRGENWLQNDIQHFVIFESITSNRVLKLKLT